MITVTAAAKEKFKEILQKQTKDPEMAIRIRPVTSEPSHLEFVLDKEKEGDYVVRDEEGAKLLLVARDSISNLRGVVIGYQKTPLVSEFVIEKLGSDIS